MGREKTSYLHTGIWVSEEAGQDRTTHLSKPSSNWLDLSLKFFEVGRYPYFLKQALHLLLGWYESTYFLVWGLFLGVRSIQKSSMENSGT